MNKIDKFKVDVFDYNFPAFSKRIVCTLYISP